MTSIHLAVALLAIATPAIPAAAQVGGREAVQSLLRPGAAVFGRSGVPVGSVASVADRTAVVATKSGPLTVAKGAFGAGLKGLYIDRTASQLDEMARAEARRDSDPAG